jgi:predicted O-linked N-acetylglucosamine transferase (SPINDLY family)
VPLRQIRWDGYSDYAEHLQFFEQIDLLLDAMPFQGGVTTCDALWMGVPVLSVLVPGRVGNGFLLQAGQTDWLCASLDDYVAKAIAVAQDLSALRALRPKVREAFDNSPLCQGAAFTRELEQIYTDLWAGRYPIKQGAA